MKIIGYSERGAMNALFYGMVFGGENGTEAMKHFLEIAQIENCDKYSEFTLFIEFSLSEFGSPDLILVAKKDNGTKAVFFVEAKASCGKYFDMKMQKDHHCDYIEKGSYDNGHASNLFFQMRLKKYFFEKVVKEKEEKDLPEEIKKISDSIKKSRGRDRSIGNNKIVRKLVDQLKWCSEAHFIAIVPRDKEWKDEYCKCFIEKMTIHFVTWEEIYEDKVLGNYIGETIDFNTNDEYYQILNNKK